jgi:putative ABC transport system permease protein
MTEGSVRTPAMRNPRFIRRQISASLHQSVLFVLCTALSLVTLVSLGGFSRSVHASFLKDARALHAADIIIHSHSPFSPPLLRELSVLERRKAVESARTYEFYSVVRTMGQHASLLSNIKAVGPGYPFYGVVKLASGRPFGVALTPGSAVVEQSLLDRLHLRIGGRIRIGDAAFTVRDIVLREPDRPVNFFSLGPRVFISAQDLASLDLLGKNSRVRYDILVKVGDPKDLDGTAALLKAAALADREQVETYKTARSGVKRFFDNFLFFLNLIGIFTLLLSGIGIQSSLTAFLKEQERSIAVMKAVGADSRFIIRSYFSVVFVLGLAGTALGIGASFLLEKILPVLFRGLLPAGKDLSIPGAAVFEGLLLGLAVVVLFTVLPLLRIKEVKPRTIFSKEEPANRRRFAWVFACAVTSFFSVVVFWKVREVKAGAYFLLGAGLLILVSLLCAAGTLRFLRKLRVKGLVLRQAMKGLFRPGNATLWIIVTLTASLAVISSLVLVEKNLDATFVDSYPLDAPNVFFIDIQPGQKNAFTREIGEPTTYYPIVRGAVIAINNEKIDREQERRKRGDNLGREFNLTYRNSLLDDERIVDGKTLFRNDWTGPQVSVLDTVLEMRDMKIGDSITFRIQGIPLAARISSIRTRTRATLKPFFYFVFPEKTLGDAPQTLFTALRMRENNIPPLQNRIVAKFPNVSVIDVTETIAVFSRIMSRLSLIVGFFTLFGIVAGVLIIISSVFATRRSRVREAVFFTILGARGRFVLAVFAAENLIIGSLSGLIALALAQAVSWIVCRKALDVAYRPFAGLSFFIGLALTLLVIAVGLGASVPILRRKPAAFLREQAEE